MTDKILLDFKHFFSFSFDADRFLLKCGVLK